MENKLKKLKKLNESLEQLLNGGIEAALKSAYFEGFKKADPSIKSFVIEYAWRTSATKKTIAQVMK